MEDIKKEFLDYEGLTDVVKRIISEIPIADGQTIVKNNDGTISAQTLYRPSVDTELEMMIFSDDSPVSIGGEALIIA